MERLAEKLREARLLRSLLRLSRKAAKGRNSRESDAARPQIGRPHPGETAEHQGGHI